MPLNWAMSCWASGIPQKIAGTIGRQLFRQLLDCADREFIKNGLLRQ